MGKLKAIFAIPELRQKIIITLLFLAIYRVGFAIPLPYVNQLEMNKSRMGGGRRWARSSVSSPCSPAATWAGPGLRPGHHALHLRLDYLPAPRRRLPAPGKAAEGRRERAARKSTNTRATPPSHLFVPGLHVCAIHHGLADNGQVRLGIPGPSTYDTWFYWMTMVVTMTAAPSS